MHRDAGPRLGTSQEGIRLGRDLGGVGAGAWDRSLHPTRGGAQAVQDAGLAERAVVGMVDVEDGSLGDQRLVLERLFGGADRLEGHARLPCDLDPLVAGEPGEGLGHERVVVGEDDDVLRIHRNPGRVIADPVELAPEGEGVAVCAGEDERGVGHPLLDPAPVGALEQPLRGPLVIDPGPQAHGVGVLHALPFRRRDGERGLEERRLDVLARAGESRA